MKYALIVILLTALNGYGSIKYKSTSNNCPIKTSNPLTLLILNEFEQSKSLYAVKKLLLKENIKDSYFLADYKIDYNPILEQLFISFDCPYPLMKVQVYKEDGGPSNFAVLADNGILYNEAYESIMLEEKKIPKKLPFLALPMDGIANNLHEKITSLVRPLRKEFRDSFSELIYSMDDGFTLIISPNGTPISAFLGKDDLAEKLKKIDEIISFMKGKGKLPAVINITNLKKVVVKFPGKS